ncbi:MAG: 4-hydroxy-3-methylbut-2-enyl diphosphate reductase [Planctomycetota bacterium]|jgi:4-hydroxy-3-methylbut-2-enyl diphosphate reductase|nr:4-hydroxy-3-methylbut-2-enyl diphosphate reductase [Planctomycetota bacterium]
MNVVVAESAGFCRGVARAVAMAESALRSGRSIWSEGPLIHNGQVVARLRELGLDTSPEGPRAGQTVLVRAHGASPEQRRAWTSAGHDLLDATCPHVARNQKLVSEALSARKFVVMAGDPGHAEVAAVLGQPGDRARLVGSAAEALNLDIPPGEPILLLAQTTFSADRFESIADAFLQLHPGVEARRTICGETKRRRDEARALAKKVDAMVVVGGGDSANTLRLAEVSADAGVETRLVETAGDLDGTAFSGCGTVGVIAGASTPAWIIEAVARRLRGLCAIPPFMTAGDRI